MNEKISRTKLSTEIKSLSIDKDDLKKILDILQLRAVSASELELIKVQNHGSVEDLDKVKANLIICSQLKVSLKGSGNQELFGTIEEVFTFPSFPEKIETLYVNSELIYRSNFNYFPENSFKLFIDFTKPKVFDFSFQASDPTPNGSDFVVEGSDNTWTNGVFFEVNQFLKMKPAKFTKIHRGSVYDLLVWFLGIPFGFWVCFKILSLQILFFKQHTFIENVLLT